MKSWSPWRSPSPLGGSRPSKEDMAAAVDSGHGREDVLPHPRDEDCAGLVRLLVVGINPSPWTVAVNAPFARPGNRFWPSLARAQILPHTVDASRGLSPADERLLAELGVGITNIVRRPTARADQLRNAELTAGAVELVRRVGVMRPRAVAVLGVTAFRSAFRVPKAALGLQASEDVPGWPGAVPLWVLPNPSGLNAHETVDTLAQKWRAPWLDSR